MMKPIYLIISSLIALLVLASLPAAANDRDDWQKLLAALTKIPSADGGTVLSRIRSCGLKIHKSASWSGTEPIAVSQLGARAGDLVVQIVFDAPPLPGDDPTLYHDLSALWIVRNGKPLPEGGWADWLQNKPPPIGSISWMNC
jgi:hypothetical protein